MTSDTHTLEDAIARVGAALAQHDPVRWRCQYRVDKRWRDWTHEDILAGLAPDPYEVIEREGNLLMTAGATALWNGLVTAGLATPFNATNAQLAVGDGTAAASASQTDLQAAEGTTVAISGATNASPIVLTTATQSWVVGQVIVVSGVAGNTAANGTWEISAVTATSATLLNSTGNGAYTSGGTAGLINKYRQLVSGAPTVTTNQVQFAATFGAANANYAWNEWAVTTGGGATNKQAVPPPTMLQRAVPGGGLGTKTSAASWTFTVTLSLS